MGDVSSETDRRNHQIVEFAPLKDVPTVIGSPNFHAEAAAMKLHEALKRIGKHQIRFLFCFTYSPFFLVLIVVLSSQK